jgi:hypothetical protein
MYENATHPDPDEKIDLDEEFFEESVECPWD